jgi:hypothetical protein
MAATAKELSVSRLLDRDAMFRRYAIVDMRDLRSAVEMLAGSLQGLKRERLSVAN